MVRSRNSRETWIRKDHCSIQESLPCERTCRSRTACLSITSTSPKEGHQTYASLLHAVNSHYWWLAVPLFFQLPILQARLQAHEIISGRSTRLTTMKMLLGSHSMTCWWGVEKIHPKSVWVHLVLDRQWGTQFCAMWVLLQLKGLGGKTHCEASQIAIYGS